MKSPGKFVAGLFLGVVLAGIMSRAWGPTGNNEGVPATVSDLPVAAESAVAPWLEPGEALISSTLVLPRGLTVEDGIVYLDYVLAGLSPALVEHEDMDYQGDVVAMPEHWVLTTTAGTIIEATTGPWESSVQFELPSADDQVAAIKIVGWRVGTPFGDRIELPIQVGATGSLRSGTVTIETVLEQRISTIVQLDFDDVDDEWQFSVLRPLDTAWRTSGRQLIWDGEDAPDGVVIEDAGIEMRPVVGEVLVIDQGDNS